MRMLPSLLPFKLLVSFSYAPVSFTMLRKETVRVDMNMCVYVCVRVVVAYIFRACVCASAPFHIYVARWTAYLLGRGRFIECGRRRSDSHVFTSRQFFHFAPLPSRTRTFDVSGPPAVWLFLPVSPFAILSSLLYPLYLSRISPSHQPISFVPYATRNSKGHLKPMSTFRLPSQACEWSMDAGRELMLQNI